MVRRLRDLPTIISEIGPEQSTTGDKVWTQILPSMYPTNDSYCICFCLPIAGAAILNQNHFNFVLYFPE